MQKPNRFQQNETGGSTLANVRHVRSLLHTRTCRKRRSRATALLYVCDFSTVGDGGASALPSRSTLGSVETGLKSVDSRLRERAYVIDPQCGGLGEAFSANQAEHVARSSGSVHACGSLAGLERTSAIAEKRARPERFETYPSIPASIHVLCRSHCVRPSAIIGICLRLFSSPARIAEVACRPFISGI